MVLPNPVSKHYLLNPVVLKLLVNIFDSSRRTHIGQHHTPVTESVAGTFSLVFCFFEEGPDCQDEAGEEQEINETHPTLLLDVAYLDEVSVVLGEF